LTHPDPERVGQIALLDAHGTFELGRSAPTFSTVDGAHVGPLSDPFVSRKPLVLKRSKGGPLVLARDGSSTQVEVDGAALDERHAIGPARVVMCAQQITRQPLGLVVR
ncbi:MAG: hypothetical protein AAF438_06530, partial [Pseudomonadota bacterium]